MSKIGRLWAGKLFGTNTGNVSAELEGEDANVSGEIRFMDDRFGLVVYAVKGSFDGTNVTLAGGSKQAPEGVVTGDVTVKGALQPDGSVRGEWKTAIGTGGAFQLFPHDPASQRATGRADLAEQVHTRTRTVGAVRLCAEDVRDLIAFMVRDFATSPKVVVTYHERGNQISRFSPDFERDMPRLGDAKLRYLKLFAQEPDAYGVNRTASIELRADGTNDVTVQGVQESWVVGKAEALSARLRANQKLLSTTMRRYANFNSLLAFATLLLLPELPLERRLVFLVAMVLLAWAFGQVHTRFIPNAVISMSEKKPSGFEIIGPQLASWLVAASSAVVALVAYALLKGWFPGILT